MLNAYDSALIFSSVGIVLLLIEGTDPRSLPLLEHRNDTGQLSPPAKSMPALYEDAWH